MNQRLRTEILNPAASRPRRTLSHSHSVHSSVSTSAHDIPARFEVLDLFAGQADLSSSGNTLTGFDELRHGRSFSWSQVGVSVGVFEMLATEHERREGKIGENSILTLCCRASWQAHDHPRRPTAARPLRHHCPSRRPCLSPWSYRSPRL